MTVHLPARIPKQTQIRVVSLNLAHGRKNGAHQALQGRNRIESNLCEIADLLSRRQPDFVALQEADGPSAWSGRFNHVEYLATAAQYPHHFCGDHVRMLRLNYGTAMLSAHPIEESSSHRFPPSPPMPPKGFVLCSAQLEQCPGLTVDLVSVHLDFARRAVRQRQCEEMIERLQGRPYPRIIMGDFNCEWSSGEQTLRRLVQKLDVHPFHPNDKSLFTFPTTRRRIDWILCSPRFRFLHHEVLAETVSDHKPILAELEYRE